MRVYYNEHDRFAAAWLRELIADGLIPEGDVDERDIQTVQPSDLSGYEQCHFFAGIGGWAYAIELAGWRGLVWTGSCPCQPFSQAGKGAGFADARHLWPAWFRLIRECRPPVVFGEQVGGPAGYHWLDLVSTDLEEVGYAFGAADLAAAGVGAPHIRQRLYFVADTERGAAERSGRDMAGPPGGPAGAAQEWEWVRPDAGDGGVSAVVGVAQDPDDSRWEKLRRDRDEQSQDASGRCGLGVALGDTLQPGLEGHAGDGTGSLRPSRRVQKPHRPISPSGASGVGQADTNRAGQRSGGRGVRDERDDVGRGGTNGQWSDVIWLPCSDGKVRPAPPEPALFPLAARLPNRVGTLRGAGNAICAPLAAEFIKAYAEAILSHSGASGGHCG